LAVKSKRRLVFDRHDKSPTFSQPGMHWRTIFLLHPKIHQRCPPEGRGGFSAWRREHALLKELLEQLHKSRIGEGERNECDGDEKIHLEIEARKLLFQVRQKFNLPF